MTEVFATWASRWYKNLIPPISHWQKSLNLHLRIILRTKTINFSYYIFQESLVKDEVSIDPRVHKMIVGRKGVGIRGIMNQYRVDIKMPRDGDDKVIVSKLFVPEILFRYPNSNDVLYLLLLSSQAMSTFTPNFWFLFQRSNDTFATVFDNFFNLDSLF